VVEWLDANRFEGYSKKAITHASKNGHLAVLEFFHKRNQSAEAWTEGALDMAALNGQISVIEFLHHSMGATCTPKAMDGAIRGHLLEPCVCV